MKKWGSDEISNFRNEQRNKFGVRKCRESLQHRDDEVYKPSGKIREQRRTGVALLRREGIVYMISSMFDVDDWREACCCVLRFLHSLWLCRYSYTSLSCFYSNPESWTLLSLAALAFNSFFFPLSSSAVLLALQSSTRPSACSRNVRTRMSHPCCRCTGR